MGRPVRAAAAPGRAWRGIRSNAFFLGVVNGALFHMGISFVDPATVLPAFVAELTRSELAVGVVAAVASVGWLLPQLLVANYVQTMPRKLPVYRVAAVVRMASLAALIVSLHALRDQPGLMLALFLSCYAMFTFAGGSGVISFLDVVGKTIPPQRIGTFFGQRQIYGGMLGLVAAGIVRQVLSADSPLLFPHNYMTLFILGAAAMAVGIFCFAIIDEPPGATVRNRLPLGEFLRRAPSVLVEDADFRRLFVVRLLMGAGVIAVPFYVVFARQSLGVPAGMLGIYLGAQTVGAIISNLLWAPMSNRHGGRRTVVGVAVVGLVAPTLAVALATLPVMPAAAGWGFCGVFLLMGAAAAGSGIAYNHYLLEVAPEVVRPTYVGVLNTFAGVMALMPILGGALVIALSYQAVFAIAAGVSAAGVAAAARLRDLRADAGERFGQRPHPAAGADREAAEM